MPIIVKNTTFASPLDLIAPLSCVGCGRIGEPLCKCCKNYIKTHSFSVCPNCKQQKATPACPNCKFLPPTYIVGKRDGMLAKLIHDFKYQSTRAIGTYLAELIEATLPPLPENAIIVPLPTSAPHIRTRALDHTLLISKSLANRRHLAVSHILIRVKNTTQVGTSRKTRLKQAEEAYTINPRCTIDPKSTYILLDDVWTTGASVKAATKILKENGAENIIIALLAMS